MLKELTCIGCPMGCRITADLTGNEVSNVSGHTCPIGERYAKEELTCPTRMVTSLAYVTGSDIPLSVKTSINIPKDMISKCLEEIREKKISLPVHTGDIIIKNVCKTKADVVATKDLY
ncbi:MAG: DUF1667 domain-containing protein [Synergistaceae bacterium]